MKITVETFPLLSLQLEVFELKQCAGELDSTALFEQGFHPQSVPPCRASDEIRRNIREMMRVGGFKPAGRSKPASEYLLKAHEQGILRSISLPVDVCNIVSYHSGIPISVVDLDRTQGDLTIAMAPSDSEVVFNAGGQSIRMDGLIALHDALGPCACGVKDSHRTKIQETTQRFLVVFWGAEPVQEQVEAAAQWYREMTLPFASRNFNPEIQLA